MERPEIPPADAFVSIASKLLFRPYPPQVAVQEARHDIASGQLRIYVAGGYAQIECGVASEDFYLIEHVPRDYSLPTGCTERFTPEYVDYAAAYNQTVVRHLRSLPHDRTTLRTSEHTLRPQSAELFAQAKRYIPGGVNSPVRAFRGVGGEPFFVTCAEAAHIYDADGREYVDFVGTWGPAILGHAPAVVVEAVRAAAGRGLSFGIPNPDEVEMARTICEWVPSIKKVRLVNSGTEATMSCVRLARGFTGRDRIIKFEGCYHGHVDSLLVKAGSGALTHGSPDSAGVPAALAELTITLPFNDEAAVREAFDKEGAQIAAVILEPIPANAGLYFARPGFLELLRELCTQHGALLIFDEVMTGFRVARGGAQEIYGITPDLTALGKVIGGGLPVGAFGGRAEIMDQLSPDGPVYQAGTLSGNPLAMAAGLAQLRELERTNAWARLEEIGAAFEEMVRATLKRVGKRYTFNRIGSMFCLFFTDGEVHDLATAQRSDRQAFARFFHTCLDGGVYFAPSQFEAGFISTAHTDADMARTGEVAARALAD